MEQKKILGLDLGSNSIGAALISLPKTINEFGKEGKIIWTGSRIIPVDGDYLKKFESGGQTETKTAARRIKRGSRRLKHRYKLRRTRLIQVFKILGWINDNFPENFKEKMKEDENYKFHISYYLPLEKSTIEEATKLLGVKNKKGELAVSEDWIIYYLRKKALREIISSSELARVIYMMNQRRGFKSSRKDLKEEGVEERKWVEILKIKSVVLKSKEKDKNKKFTYIVTPYSSIVKPWEEKRFKKPEWDEKEFTFLITEKSETKKDGTKKITQNKPQIPTPDDWELCMVALDNQIDNQTPGEFFFDKLTKDKNYKIRQITVRREKYKKELETIWQKQCELNESLRKLNTNKNILQKIAAQLYPSQTKSNNSKLKEILSNDLLHLISDDIIYYQRELKSQKNSVDECQYEKHKGIDGELYGVKCAPKSNPDFQEYHIWQDIHNIRIFEREVRETQNGITFAKIDVDVTNRFIDVVEKEKLFELFDSSNAITEESIFKKLNEIKPTSNLTNEKYRINLFTNRKSLAGNETKDIFRKVFKKNNYKEEGDKLLADKKTFQSLWHINYSISSSDLEKSSRGIRTALSQFRLPANVVEAFTKLPEPSQKKYAAYSSKAIKKLLPLMRCGQYWNWGDIHSETKQRIEKIINDGWDFSYDKRTGELIKEREFTDKAQFSGLPVWMACYVTYGRHSERQSDKKYENVDELNVMKVVPNNSLRNPIVEQVIRETLFLVKDLWKQYGQPDEIHIELGRELKKNALEKERIAIANTKHFEEKKRIKKLLSELMNGSFESYNEEGIKIKSPFAIKPNPDNPADIEKFRVYKSCGTITFDEEKEHWDILFKEGKKERVPTSDEVKKYALWLSQKCTSPYTSRIISLSKLFTEEYEVEHIIPRKKLKYDAFENLVICERGVNKLKGNELAMVFISKHNGAELTYEGNKYKLQTVEGYTSHCKNTFRGRKLKNLLTTEVPEDFVERQINDTRYITRKVSELLYPITKDKAGLVFTIGSITSDLKNEWGLNSVWKEILKPRFERLQSDIIKEPVIFTDSEDKNKFHFHVKQNPELEIKRLDHRHHAMDALIIAATTREHIRYLNSLSAVDTSKELQKVRYALVKGKIREFRLPWENFTKDAKEKLNETIVTFKSSNKVVSKPTNRYMKWVQKSDGSWKKEEYHQKQNKKWMAVRKSMFKEPQGIIWLKEKKEVTVLEAFKIQIERMKVEHDGEKRKTASYIYDKFARLILKSIIGKIGIDLDNTKELLAEVKEYLDNNSKKIELGKNKKNGKPDYKTVWLLEGHEFEKIWIAEFSEYAAKRVKVDNSFTHDKIDKLPYAKERNSPLAELLHEHLKSYKDEYAEAFSGEGMEALAKKAGKKIDKVTIYEKKSPDDKFGNRYVEVDKGAVAYFIIYEDERTKERQKMYSLATHKAIERLVSGEPIADKKEGFKTIVLSPNDLVYVPTDDEWIKIKSMEHNVIDWSDKKKIVERVYKMVSADDAFFIQHYISKPIIPYDRKEKIRGEIDWNNKSTKTLDGKTNISERCIKMEVDRLGNIKPAL